MVWREQGLGDEIHFYSTIKYALRKCQKLIIECDIRLIPLLKRSYPEAEVRPNIFINEDPSFRSPLKDYDYHISVGQLYTKCYSTKKKFKEVEVIQWRMKVKGQYVPGATGEIKVCNIGISQSIKTSILLEYPFEPSWCEDYNLLNRLKNANKKIIISDNVTYLVRNENASNNPKFTKRFYNFQPLT